MKRKPIEDTTDESDQDTDGINERSCRVHRMDSVLDRNVSCFDLYYPDSELDDPYGSDDSDEWQPQNIEK